MSSQIGLALVFAGLWLATWYPCWKLMLKLMAMVASPKGLDTKFWMIFILYRLLIALPYLVLLWFGEEVLGDVLETVIIGFTVMALALSLLRFTVADRIIAALWYVYGFVYDGLLKFYPYRKLIDDVMNMCDAEMKQRPGNILEIGCGTGNVLVELGRHYPQAELTGIDISPSMLRIARRKTNARLEQVDAHAFLSRVQAKYDLIVLQNSLYAIPDRDKLWPLLLNTLNKNGKIVITNSDKPGSATIIREHLDHASWISLLNPRLVLVGIIDSFISQLSGEGAFDFVPEEKLRHEITENNGTMSRVKRVYGGVNVLFSVNRGAGS